MEMTQNHVYDMPAVNISMETNVGYGAASESRDGSLEMIQNQMYGVPPALNISMETNVGYGVSKTKPLNPVDKKDTYDYI